MPVTTAPGTTPITCAKPGGTTPPAIAPVVAAPPPSGKGFRRHFVAVPAAVPVTPPPSLVIDCTAPSTEVMVVSHTQGGEIVRSGATLIGRIATPSNTRTLKAEVTGVADTQRTLQVDATSGQFAYRVSDNAMTIGAPVRVKFTLERTDGTLHEPTFTYGPADDVSGLALALNRLSFGATPALYARVKQIGFEAYVNEQLTPDTIDDTAFAALRLDDMLTIDWSGAVGFVNSWYFAANAENLRLDTAVGTNKQLLEVMALFWKNHFWSVLEDNPYAVIPQQDDARAYRSMAFGTFRDMLIYSAKSGQMMDYLDNNTSSKGAINENYARELMELHTVGINGGYSNDDIMVVAAILTGWSYKPFDDPRYKMQYSDDNLGFWFDPTIHDSTNKTVKFLNRTFVGRTGADGVKEGEELLDVLANHPKTQEFVCGKIVAYLVSEDRPAPFVARCVTTWSQTGGHIGAILRDMLLSEDYRKNVAFPQSKVRTPFEYAVSILRNFGQRPLPGKGEFRAQVRSLNNDAGQNFNTFPVPTGFPEQSDLWSSPASLLIRSDRAQDILRNATQSTSNFQKLLTDAGMTTAEAGAAHLLALGTGDRYRQEEFDAVVALLKGTEGKLDLSVDQLLKIRRALGLIVALPSYQLQ